MSEISTIKRLQKELDEACKRAGDRWKQYDAERQNHDITKRDLRISLRIIKELVEYHEGRAIGAGLPSGICPEHTRAIRFLDRTVVVPLSNGSDQGHLPAEEASTNRTDEIGG
jgi:hypothetical protein